MKKNDLMLVETVGPHDCRATGKSYERGQRYVLPRDKAEYRQKQGLVAILRTADKPVKAKGAAPENKMVSSAPENKMAPENQTLAANSKRELEQLADGLGLNTLSTDTKQDLIAKIGDARARQARQERAAELDADARKGGAVQE